MIMHKSLFSSADELGLINCLIDMKIKIKESLSSAFAPFFYAPQQQWLDSQLLIITADDDTTRSMFNVAIDQENH